MTAGNAADKPAKAKAPARAKTPKAAPAEQTEAVVLDPEGVETTGLILKWSPGSAIEGNFDALEARIEALIKDHQGVVVAEADIAQAKRERAWLNGLAKDLDQRRLEVKRAIQAPLTPFEERVKAIIAKIKVPSNAIDEQIKAFEIAAERAKRVELVKHWEEYAGALADVVPFEQIEDVKWSLKSTSIMASFEAIEKIVDRIASDYETLSSLDLAHPVEAKADYYATLDLSHAIACSRELEERIVAAKKLEDDVAANKAAREAEAAASEPVAEVPPGGYLPLYTSQPEPVPEPVTAPQEPDTAPVVQTAPECAVNTEKHLYAIKVECTQLELQTITVALKGLGFTGTVSIVGR